VKQRLLTLFAVFFVLGCGDAGTSANQSPQKSGTALDNQGGQRAGALHPIRYGYRGGPYTTGGGKPRPKNSSNESAESRP
jgi:hypothetical protein